MIEQRSLPKPLRICSGTELLRLLRVLKAMQHMKFYQRTCIIAAWFNTLGLASLCAFAGLSPSQEMSNQAVLQALITRTIDTIEVSQLLTTCREAWDPHILPTQVTESHPQHPTATVSVKFVWQVLLLNLLVVLLWASGGVSSSGGTPQPPSLGHGSGHG